MAILELNANNLSLEKLHRDILGYLIPGMTVLIVLYYKQYYPIKYAEELIKFGSIANFVIFLISAYVIGRTMFEAITFFISLYHSIVKYIIRPIWKNILKNICKADAGNSISQMPISEADIYIYNEEHKAQSAEQERNLSTIFFSKGMMGVAIILTFFFKDWNYLVVFLIFLAGFAKGNRQFIKNRELAREVIRKKKEFLAVK